MAAGESLLNDPLGRPSTIDDNYPLEAAFRCGHAIATRVLLDAGVSLTAPLVRAT